MKPSKNIEVIFKELLYKYGIEEDNPNSISYKLEAIIIYLDSEHHRKFLECKHTFSKEVEYGEMYECSKCGVKMKKM